VGHSQGHAKGKVYSYMCLHLKKRDFSNNLMMHLKLLEKQEQSKPRTSKWREVTKIRAKIKEFETKQTIQTIDETKSCFFQKINEIDKPLANMTKQRGKKIQINKIRHEKGEITTNTRKRGHITIQKTIREYFENLYSSKLENLDEMDKFLVACNQPKLSQRY
jgi:hypothetical protein